VSANAGRELVKRERLGDVIDGARVQSGDAIVDLRTRGEHDHRQGGLQRAQLGEHVEPVAFGSMRSRIISA